MKLELKCSNLLCNFLEVLKVESIEPDKFISKCPKCGAVLEKGYDI